MSINVVRLLILGLDKEPYGIKRSHLPSGTRFGTVAVEISWLTVLSGTSCPFMHVSAP